MQKRRCVAGLRTALLLAIVVLASWIAGCGGGGSGVSGLKISPNTPAPSGDVNSVVWDDPHGEPISLDPLKAYNYAENTVLANACEALLSIAPDFSLQPQLASSFKRASPTEWDYTIRRGVKFWDGHTLTPADVVFSIRRHLDPANGSYYLTPFGQEISSVSQVGPDTVRVVTKRPSVIVNELMATGLGTIGEANYIQAKGKSYGTPQGGLMCTGPFKFDQWVPGQSITLTKNPQYWDSSHAAHAQTLEFRFIDDQSLLTNALLSGEIDGSYEAPASAVNQLANTSAGHLYLGPAINNVALLPTFAAIQGPLRDIRVRQALSLAIDKAGLAKTVYGGAASPIKSTLIMPVTYPFAADEFNAAYDSLPSAARNLDMAKQLIEQAGGAPSQSLTLAIQAADARSTQTANEIVAAGQEIGLHIAVKQVQATDFDNLFFDPAARNKFDLILGDNFGDFADPLEFLAFAALPGVQNFTHYNNPDVTNLYYAAQDTGNDQQKRAALTIQAVKIFQQSLQIIPLLYTPERLFMGTAITGASATFPYQYHPWGAVVGAGGG